MKFVWQRVMALFRQAIEDDAIEALSLGQEEQAFLRAANVWTCGQWGVVRGREPFNASAAKPIEDTRGRAFVPSCEDYALARHLASHLGAIFPLSPVKVYRGQTLAGELKVGHQVGAGPASWSVCPYVADRFAVGLHHQKRQGERPVVVETLTTYGWDLRMVSPTFEEEIVVNATIQLVERLPDRTLRLLRGEVVTTECWRAELLPPSQA